MFWTVWARLEPADDNAEPGGGTRERDLCLLLRKHVGALMSKKETVHGR